MPTFKRPQRIQRNRRGFARSATPLRLTLVPSTIDFTTPNVLATFATPVVLSGIPQWLTNTGKLPVSATRPTPTTVLMVYDTPGSVTDVTIPVNDPAIRSSTGGYCSPGTFPAT